MSKLSSTLRQNQEKGQGLVEYALILVLVGVVCLGIMSVVGGGVGNVFCSVTSSLGAKLTSTPCVKGPQEGDTCVDYYSPTWHYIQRYHNGAWGRIAEPGGSLPTCSFSAYPPNGSRA